MHFLKVYFKKCQKVTQRQDFELRRVIFNQNAFLALLGIKNETKLPKPQDLLDPILGLALTYLEGRALFGKGIIGSGFLTSQKPRPKPPRQRPKRVRRILSV